MSNVTLALLEVGAVIGLIVWGLIVTVDDLFAWGERQEVFTGAGKNLAFNGSDYDDARDRDRLTDQMARVKAVLSDHKWHTLEGIAAETKDPTPSISAQLRHLRKERFGGHIIDKNHIGGGLYEYRLVPKGQVDLEQAIAEKAA